MAKRFLFKLLSAGIVLFALVLYLLVQFDVVNIPVTYNIGIFFLILMAGFGALYLITGILTRSRVNLYIAGVLLAGTWIYLSIEFFNLDSIIIIVGSLALLAAMYFLAVLLNGGTTATTADNDKIGYKNFEQRQKEKEKEEEKEEKQLEKDKKSGKVEDIKIKSFKD
jgi:hypothetical protein